jgi:predicted transcriptional regulator
LVDRALIYGFRAPVVAMDQRSLALTCGLKQATVAAAIRRLVDMGLVSIEREHARRQTTTYGLYQEMDVHELAKTAVGLARGE